MQTRIKLGGWLALGISVGVAVPFAVAQHPGAHYAQQKPPKPPKTQHQKPPEHTPQQAQNENRPPNTSHNQNQPQHEPQQTQSYAKPEGNGFEGRSGAGNERLTPRQQLGVGTPRPWVDQMRSLPPQQRERVLQNSQAFQKMPPAQQNRIRQQFNQWDKLSPQQRADQQVREDVWRKLTPGQKDHIKNDVLPNWRQMPPDRKQAISRRLSMLQNMPESARNQRLNDPQFTRGMSEEDKATLKDLSLN